MLADDGAPAQTARSREPSAPGRRLKVCLFTETYFPEVGGGETQTRLLAEGLTANGHSAVVLTRRSNRSSDKVELVGPVRVYRLPPAGSGQLKKWGLIFTSLPQLVALSREYDLIFVSGFRIVGVAAVLVGKALRKRTVLKADSRGEMSGEFFRAGLQRLGFAPTGRLFRVLLALRNAILRRADAFSAISTEISSEIRSAGVSLHKIQMIPNGVDTTRFFPADPARKAQLRGKLGLPQEAAIAVYAGRLVRYKGLPLMLRVWGELRKAHGHAILVLAGTGGLDIDNCEAELREYARENGLSDCVQFVGSVPNVQEYLQAADLFVFPTENDAFPSALIEAMTCALPVVTTPVGAISSIVTDQQTGLLVPVGDHQKLYQALDRLLSDPASARHLGQGAWQTVQQRYSAAVVTEMYQKLFQAILGRPRYAPLTAGEA